MEQDLIVCDCCNQLVRRVRRVKSVISPIMIQVCMYCWLKDQPQPTNLNDLEAERFLTR